MKTSAIDGLERIPFGFFQQVIASRGILELLVRPRQPLRLADNHRTPVEMAGKSSELNEYFTASSKEFR